MGRKPCCDKDGLKKGPWAPEEDMRLIQYIQMHGPRNWRTLPNKAGLQRCGKSCRLRWTNYLRPDIKRGRFSFEEEETIIKLHSSLGNKWSAIAARLPGRTDNEIKNYWNTHIRKRLLRSGIDPVTHAPRIDLLHLSTLFNSPQLNQSNPFLGKFNVSNLILLQALLNPEALKLALNLLASSSNPNPDILLQKLLENNHNLFNNSQNQTPILPPNEPDNTMSQSVSDITNRLMQGNNIGTTNGQIFQENDMTSNTSKTCESFSSIFPSFFYDQIRPGLSENSSFQSPNSICSNNNSNNFSFDSESRDEREGFLSSLMRFEIPESFNIEDLM